MDAARSGPLAGPAGTEQAAAMAALLLIGDGATAAGLAERFASLAEAGEPAGAARLLERLARLGLVRVAAVEGESPRYVLTSLGQELARQALGADAEVESRLEELERLRSDLLSTIAHELRTPLTAIRTCVGLLLDLETRGGRRARKELLRTVADSAERMQRFVADVLDLTRFHSGGIQLQPRRFDARGLARDAAAALGPLLVARGQTLDLALGRRATPVYGDRRRLEQALLNLLVNAHKFSPDGARIRLAVETQDGAVRWSVADEGPGIAEADRRRLFERFFTVARGASDRRGGTGLGLPIALAIAQAHGGTIEVESEPGRGSTFTLSVPARGLADLEEP